MKIRWLTAPGAFLCRRIPPGIRDMFLTKVKKAMKGQRLESEEELDRRSRRFVEEELTVFFFGIIFLLLLAVFLLIRTLSADEKILLPRSPFGEGAREQELLLKNKDGQESVSVIIEEQKITDKEINQMYQSFFKELEKHMKADNSTLLKVNHPLCFDDEIDGYPFEISYEPEDLSLIGLDGSLGEAAGLLAGKETEKTRITVTASYRDYRREKSFSVILAAADRRPPLSSYDKVLGKLVRLEENSRSQPEVMFPVQVGEMQIQVSGSSQSCYGLFLLAIMIPAAIIVHRYHEQKEDSLRRKQEAAQDFPAIVHLLTLYMKAGASFSSAIHRISSGYRTSLESGSRRLAYEEIVFMDRQMQMGVSQKEVCARWGDREGNSLYRKLAVTMTQMLTKGSKEADRILSELERDAFDQRIDRARKTGKEAETKLLFPMILLLCLVMVIVLFPALVRFQGF